MPDIEYTPQVCLRVAQTETRYTSRKKALALAAEARQGFALLALVPIWLYRGRQGYHSRWVQTVCYLFYPVHILVLAMLVRFLR